MSGADYFDDGFAINSHMDDSVPVNLALAHAEHEEIKNCFLQSGIEVLQVPPPSDCQDGIYAANWGLVRGNRVVMSNLPNKRQAEQPYAEEILRNFGYETLKIPQNLPFSGQGDALPCGDYLFVGSIYRTHPDVHAMLKEYLGFNIISLQTVPELDSEGNSVINPVTGWHDSFFYDLDLALAVISPNMIAWCPEAFTQESQTLLRSLTDIEKIEVSMHEAKDGFACNLVSTGEYVIMSDRAPRLQEALSGRGLKIFTPHVTELAKGGGFIRCTSLTL